MDSPKRSSDLLSRLALFLTRQYKQKGSFTMTITSFLFGVCSFGTGMNPFALALLVSTDKLIFPSFAGAFFSCVFAGKNAALSLILMAVIASLKGYMRMKGKRLPLSICLLISLLAAFSLALSTYLVSDRAVYTLVRCAAYAAVIPLFCFLYSGLFAEHAPLGEAHRRVGQIAVCFTAACVFSTVSYSRLSLGIVWSLALTLYVAYRCAKAQPYKAMAIGCVTGFVCALGCNSLVSFPALGLCGLCAGFLFVSTKYYAVVFSLLVSVLFSVISGSPSMLPSSLIHAAFAIPVFAAFLKLPDNILDMFGFRSISQVTADARSESADTLARLESSFSSLSKAFNDVTKQRNEKTAEILNAPLQCCAGCGGCFSNGLDEFSVKQFFADYLDGNTTTLPPEFTACCPSAYAVTATLDGIKSFAGGGYLAHTADEYMDFSKLLCSLRTKEDEKQTEDKESAEQVKNKLHALGISCRRVSVKGSRCSVVEAYDVDAAKMQCSSNELRAALEAIIKKKLCEPEFIVVGECVTMRLTTVCCVSAEYSKVSRAKKGERENGDTTDVFKSKENLFYALIGDGMGSGEEASVCSRLSCMFLEKLLLLGADKRDAFTLLNKVLVKKGDECFASLDLLELDRYDGTVTLLKAGGAPTLVIRENKACPLSTRSSPLGILDTVSLGKIRFKPEKGDYILMISDGVADDEDSIASLCEFLSARKYRTTSELALSVLDRATETEHRNDDTSVIAIKIV